MQLILLGGRSGAGKTTALNLLEDLGLFYIDNLPLSLLLETVNGLQQDNHYAKVVIGLDPRSFKREDISFSDIVIALKNKQLSLQIWALQADQAALINRYNETRRKHPFSNKTLSLEEALNKENEILEALYEHATKKINTTNLSIGQLKQTIKDSLGALGASQLQVHLFSFGFKYHEPRADFLFDVRCLPNPHWQEGLRHQTGLDSEVAAFLKVSEAVNEMEEDLYSFISKWLPKFFEQDRSYIDIGIGCTGGQHRSVYLVECLAKKLNKYSDSMTVSHRESEKW